MKGAGLGQEARIFHTLDALRGIAAIGVVGFHMSQTIEPLAVPGGYLAVDLFFMMSGVVLSHAYEARFRSGMGVFEFMRARLIRLYPLYLLATLFGIAVAVASMHGGNVQGWNPATLAQAALLALVFLPNLSGRPVEQIFPLNIPCWSLFLELVVNLIFVLVWPLLTTLRLVMLCVLTAAAVGWLALQSGHIDLGSTVATAPAGLLRTLFGFFTGVLIARHFSHHPRRQNNFMFIGIVAVVAAALTGAPSGEWRAVWDAVCALLLFPVIVYGSIRIEPSPRLRTIATFLGVTSYAIYVFHGPLASVVNSAMRYLSGNAGLQVGAPYIGIAVVSALVIGCWLIDRNFDAPVRRKLNRMIHGTGS